MSDRGDPGLEAKTKFNGCMQIARLAADLRNRRQQYEWKVTLGLWALLVAAAAKQVHIPIWVYPITIVAYSFLWLRGIAVADESDRRLLFHYLDAARQLLTDPNHHVTTKENRVTARELRWYIGFLYKWAGWFEFLTTSFLVWMVYEIIEKGKP